MDLNLFFKIFSFFKVLMMPRIILSDGFEFRGFDETERKSKKSFALVSHKILPQQLDVNHALTDLIFRFLSSHYFRT